MRSHPHEKTGRNDPCPCGSGKKYKQCCLTSAAESANTPWSRQRDASDRMTPEMLKLASREVGDDLLLAWADFNQVPIPKPFDKYPNEEAIFSPYLIFDWNPDASIRRRDGRPRAGVVAQSYMEKNAKRLSELELLILHQAISRPVSFYEIVHANPGRGVLLRDVLIGEETEVEEHTASQTMRQGDLVYGQIWILPEVATLGRLAPNAIPPDGKAEIVALRAQLRRKIAKQDRELDAGDLIRYAEQIRTVYLNIRDGLLTPPRLANTDGDLIVFHTLTFRISSAQVAFDALAPLAWGQSKQDLLDGAELNGDGSLKEVAIDWRKKGNKMHKTWDNTILGHLKIVGRSLVVEVNSTKRAEKIREEIDRRLGFHAIHLSTISKTPEEMLAESKRKKGSHSALQEKEAKDPLLDPELKREFEAMVQEQVEEWVHTKVPALGGRTPLEAVADPDGKEIVEGLLLGWERSLERDEGLQGSIRPNIDAVRRLLNLPV